MVIWTVIDAYAFVPDDQGIYSIPIKKARYSMLGIVSIYPAYAILKTIYLYLKYICSKKNSPQGNSVKKSGSQHNF
jgi:hypothetical protein